MTLLIDVRHGRPSAPDDGAVMTDRREREQATTEAIRRMRRAGCPRAEREQLREHVVRWQLPLAERLARGYRNRGEDLDDLRQVAALALVKAIAGFDPDRGSTFVGYATPTILGEVKRHFRDRVWSVHVPRQLQERCLDATRVRAELVQRLQRSPSLREVAEALGVTETEARTTEASASAYRPDSLNRRVGFEHDSAERQDLLGDDDPELDNLGDRVTVRDAIETLPARARYVVHRYYFEHRTQDQIAAELGTSQMTVSRVLAHALAQLRTRLSTGAAEDDGSGTADRLRVRIYEARPGCLVATVAVPAGEFPAARLRAVLIDIAVTRRPRMLVLDLRRLGHCSPLVARVLMDTHRACAHVGASLHVLNVAVELFELLHHAGITRLLPCRPVTYSPPPGSRESQPAATGAAVGEPTVTETPHRTSYPRDRDGRAAAALRERRCSVALAPPPRRRTAVPRRMPHSAVRPGGPRFDAHGASRSPGHLILTARRTGYAEPGGLLAQSVPETSKASFPAGRRGSGPRPPPSPFIRRPTSPGGTDDSLLPFRRSAVPAMAAAVGSAHGHR
ncbi:sigma-70 family RNA polymerase sigma factor [Jidongwangia harbinensis]|uniref:sigma-70 family RNA polymerase sigma factor n=1 Tax=Jidongwangia harbinensis TaxID=2878561 RepID=UPI001CD9CA63|nr:sigma-70 family RNA polymerase sigma factor [Jidongwangia harbinensis]MCA2219039.1 sigma-70 family RNA polymerase sigma factor [Jidongwangia harbinensis]